MRQIIFGVVLLVLAFSCRAQDVLISSGLAGSWWNAARSGEGTLIEMARYGSNPNTNIGVYWYTYQNRKPVYLVGFAPLASNVTNVTVELFQTEGALFGSAFSTQDVTSKPWGKIILSFTSCTSGKVIYQGVDGTSGEIALQRFGTPVGVSCTVVKPTGNYTYPFFRGDWRVFRSTDAITSAVTCELSVRKRASQYDVVMYFIKRRDIGIRHSAYVAATSSTFSANNGTSFYRVDQNTAFSFSQLAAPISLPFDQPINLDAANAPFKSLMQQMNVGQQLVVRIDPENQFVSLHEASFGLGASFLEAKGAFNACIDSL